MKKGTSLIETIIMVFVLAILLQIGAAAFHRMEPKYRLQAALWGVLSQMNHARFQAILDGTPVRIRFSPGHYSLEEWDEAREDWRMSDISMAQGITLSANNTPVFYPEGTVSNLATITISNDWGAYKISLAITGRAKVTKL